MKKALITFVKAPVPGTVKTRLQADMPVDEVVEIYKSFVREITSGCSRLKGIDRFLGCAPSKDDPFLREITEKYEMVAFNQRGDDLGKRIVNGFRDIFKKGYSSVVLIGSDSPTIPKEYIRKAFRELEKKDFIVGPCCDGGMYLIGAKNSINPRIFQKITWDSSDVLNLTMSNLFRLNIPFSMLPFWYDIDNIDDLKFLKLHLKHLKKEIPYIVQKS